MHALRNFNSCRLLGFLRCYRTSQGQSLAMVYRSQGSRDFGFRFRGSGLRVSASLHSLPFCSRAVRGKPEVLNPILEA